MNRIGETLTLAIPDAAEAVGRRVACVLRRARRRSRRQLRAAPRLALHARVAVRAVRRQSADLAVPGVRHPLPARGRPHARGVEAAHGRRARLREPLQVPRHRADLRSARSREPDGEHDRSGAGRRRRAARSLSGAREASSASPVASRPATTARGAPRTRPCDPSVPTIAIPVNFVISGIYSEVEVQPTALARLHRRAAARSLRRAHRAARHAARSRLSPRAALFLAQPEQYGAEAPLRGGLPQPERVRGRSFDDDASFKANPKICTPRRSAASRPCCGRSRCPGLSTRLSALLLGRARHRRAAARAADRRSALLQFQNVTRYVSAGVEAEGSYRDSRGWYAFGGVDVRTRSAPRTTDGATSCSATSQRARAHRERRRLDARSCRSRAHVSTRARSYIGERPTRPDVETGNASPDSPGVGRAGTRPIYVPNVRGFDVTAGVRNLIGTRDLDARARRLRPRPSPMSSRVPRIPGEGRELYVKVGYCLLASPSSCSRLAAVPARAQRPNQGEDESAALVDEGRAALRQGRARRCGEGARPGDRAQPAARRGLRAALGGVRGAQAVQRGHRAHAPRAGARAGRRARC